MKRILSLLTLFIIVTSCQQDDTEKIIENDFPKNEILKITEASFFNFNEGKKMNLTLGDIKLNWEKQILEENDLKVDLNKFELIKTYDPDTKEHFYFLKAEDEGGLISTGSFLIKNSNLSNFEIKGKTCECEGCPNGCSLTVFGDTCRCSPCNPTSSKCTKKESQVIEIM